MSTRATGLFAGAFGILAAALVVCVYVRTTQPAIFGGADHPAQVAAGGGAIPTLHYALLSAVAVAMAALFVFAGHFVARRTGFLAIRALSPGDLGIFYFVGMSLFLQAFGALALLSGRAAWSASLIVALFAASAIYTCASQRVFQRAAAAVAVHARLMACLLPVAVTVLCGLHYLVNRRAGMGTGWFYYDLARYVVTLDRVPLVNRHYGQSLLSSLGLFVVGVGRDRSTYSQVALDSWLFLSELALAFVFYRFLRGVGVSKPGGWAGVAILMAGNTALSLLPHIVYDHDYPYVMNLYTDSLFGIAGWLVIVLYLLQRCRHVDHAAAAPAVSTSLIVPALLVMTFNSTSELNIPIVLLLVVALMVLNGFRRWTRVSIPTLELVTMLLVFGVFALVGAFQGGVFAGRVVSAERRAASPFWELDADVNSSRMSITEPAWWYLPHIVLGLPTGFGNLLQPAALEANPAGTAASATLESPGSPDVSRSANARLLDRFGASAPPIYRFVDAVYLMELRAYQTVRVIRFPLVGIVALGCIALRPLEASPLRFFWCVACIAFLAGGAGVFLTNSAGGNAFYWKWGLTRLFEPGLCLAMIAFVVVVDRGASMIQSRTRRYACWAILASFMAFGTVLRIFFYPTFNG